MREPALTSFRSLNLRPIGGDSGLRLIAWQGRWQQNGLLFYHDFHAIHDVSTRCTPIGSEFNTRFSGRTANHPAKNASSPQMPSSSLPGSNTTGHSPRRYQMDPPLCATFSIPGPATSDFGRSQPPVGHRDRFGMYCCEHHSARREVCIFMFNGQSTSLTGDECTAGGGSKARDSNTWDHGRGWRSGSDPIQE